MTTKVLLILPPHSTDYSSFNYPSWDTCRIPPIGLISLASHIKSKGYDVQLADCRELILTNRSNNYIDILIQLIKEKTPDFVGINILTALFSEAFHISSKIKEKFPNLPIIAGGPHPSIEPLLTLQQIPALDAVCVGPGEEVFIDVLQSANFKQTPGLMHRENTENFTPRDIELEIDKYCFPDYKIAPSNYYTTMNGKTTFGWMSKSLSALTSRSCPYSCKFCASDWSKPFRYHSAEYVVELAKYLSSFDIDTIAFWDDTIAFNTDRLVSICEGFILSGLFSPLGRIRWRASMRANQITKDILNIMKKAGCYHVAVGIESGSDRILKLMNKKSTTEMNKNACSLIKQAGLDVGISFMIGVPTETEKEIRQTFDFIKKLNCNTKGTGNFRPLPGSPFYKEFIAAGLLQKNKINWDNLGNFSTNPEKLHCDVPKEKFLALMKEANQLAYGEQWIAVFEDLFIEDKKKFREINSKLPLKIAPKSNYSPEFHSTLTQYEKKFP